MTRPPHTMAAAGSASRTRRRHSHSRARVAFALAVLLGGCRAGTGDRNVSAPPERPLTEVLAAHTPDLMKVPGVVGTAESQLDDGRPCILVLAARITPELRKRIPGAIEGWPVRIQETGEIRAMPGPGR